MSELGPFIIDIGIACFLIFAGIGCLFWGAAQFDKVQK
jgi:hypothetical protein